MMIYCEMPRFADSDLQQKHCVTKVCSFFPLSRRAGPSEDNDKLSNQNENEDKYEARITDDDTDNAAANLDGRDDADSDDDGKISDDDDIIHPV